MQTKAEFYRERAEELLRARTEKRARVARELRSLRQHPDLRRALRDQTQDGRLLRAIFGVGVQPRACVRALAREREAAVLLRSLHSYQARPGGEPSDFARLQHEHIQILRAAEEIARERG